MLLKESYASTGVTEVTTFELLESLPSLNESLSSYNGEMVPIRHNSRLGKNLIQLEDFYKYSTINNFEDGDAAIGAVCESNMISVDGSIGFMVNEASLYANDELAQLAEEVKTAGYPFYVSEISSSSNYYKNLQEALALDEGATCFEESQALQAFCEGVLEDKLAGVTNGINNAVGGAVNNFTNTFNARKRQLGAAADQIKSKVTNGFNAVKNAPGNAMNMINNARNAFTNGANDISNRLAAINKTIREKTAQLQQVPGNAKMAIQNQINSLRGAASALQQKLVAAKNNFVH